MATNRVQIRNPVSPLCWFESYCVARCSADAKDC